MAKAAQFDLDAVRAALGAQMRLLREYIDGLPDPAFAAPTRLGTWTVAELIAHLGVALGVFADWVRAPEPSRADLTLARYYDAGRGSEGLVDRMARAAAEARTPNELRASVAQSFDALATATAAVAPGRVLATRLGAVDATELLVTRCVEAVVHGLDLQQATGVPATASAAVDRPALAVVVKSFAVIAQQRAPGHSVEVRVPGPGGTAFQCGEGPQHTRGTPPNVVETDPLTFVELGSGRLGWADALERGAVRASGARADLAPLLPFVG